MHDQALSIMFFAWISDKYRQRAMFIAIQTLITLIGLFLTGFSSSPAWRYTGTNPSISAKILQLILFYRLVLKQCRFRWMYTVNPSLCASLNDQSHFKTTHNYNPGFEQHYIALKKSCDHRSGRVVWWHWWNFCYHCFSPTRQSQILARNLCYNCMPISSAPTSRSHYHPLLASEQDGSSFWEINRRKTRLPVYTLKCSDIID